MARHSSKGACTTSNNQATDRHSLGMGMAVGRRRRVIIKMIGDMEDEAGREWEAGYVPG